MLLLLCSNLLFLSALKDRASRRILVTLGAPGGPWILRETVPVAEASRTTAPGQMRTPTGVLFDLGPAIDTATGPARCGAEAAGLG